MPTVLHAGIWGCALTLHAREEPCVLGDKEREMIILMITFLTLMCPLAERSRSLGRSHLKDAVHQIRDFLHSGLASQVRVDVFVYAEKSKYSVAVFIFL